MITRRTFLGAVSAVSAAGLASSHGLDKLASAVARSSSAPDLTKYVKLAIGTGGHGHTYPGATVPFGMVQLSPDTFNEGWDHCSGYHYSDTSIMGFSHTHLSGTGAADLLDFLLMPGTGPVKTVPGSLEHPEEGYRSRFSHADEIAEPGYYSVLLKDYGIRAELSATERAGIHKYTFPKSDSSHFILDLTHLNGGNPKSILWSNVKFVGNDTITGGRSTALWAAGREIYFAMKFSRPFASSEIVADDQKLDPSVRQSDSKSLKCLVHFQTAEGEVIYVKTGISGVSAEAAMKNLDAEIPGWDFAKVKAQAHSAWQQELSAITVESASQKHKEIFYTGLYHALVSPTLFDDVDGHYRGMDGKVHQLEPGLHNYSTFSLWDTYRATHPLYTLAQGKRVPDLVNCLIRMADESPAGMPVWPLHARETACMTGYHSVVVMAEAHAKGFRGIEFDKAYSLVRKRALEEDYQGLAAFRKEGYIACDKEPESTSKTMDYAYDSWAAAHLARAAGAHEDAAQLLAGAGNYRNLYDKTTTFIRPKLANGEWAEPFSPIEIGHSKQWRDYTESNPWVTTFSAQHDPKGLGQLFGGREALVAKLDALFSAPSDLPPDAPPDIAGLVGQYAHGNEPGHHIAYLYACAGAPYKTQERVRSLLETMYDNQPDGLAGNEDCGQMSAWYIISALGFYAVDPVSANYVFGSPLFDRAAIRLANGKELVLETKRKSPEDKYIQSVTFNGKPHTKVWFSHADVANGGTFVFTMGSEPNKAFGADESAAPPSMTA
ncbi:MAG TPA: GH92 family glycosyl hydrolase [Acidisarcina sp.]|nr:GH92 family glycosyl hydrolase [Acidisarcina sp.]